MAAGDVDAPELLHRPRDQVAASGHGAHVGAHSEGLPAVRPDLRHGVLRARFICVVVGDDRCPGVGQADGQVVPDALAGARYQGHFARQIRHAFLR